MSYFNGDDNEPKIEAFENAAIYTITICLIVLVLFAGYIIFF